ncbi:MAG TPA: phosphatase PAP2 family protein [Gemmataceae bacterium]|nr:phosphatase PAP2 family protein [Gemmataceae bacterium]
MTPRPRRYLFLSLICTCLFAVLAVLVEAGSAIVRLDERLVVVCHEFAVDHPAVRDFFAFVTDLGYGWLLWIVGTAAVLALAVRRDWFRALAWAVGLLASRPVTPWLKGQFGRVRPPFVDWADFSFPSGHAFASAVVYGLFALVVMRVWHGSRWRWALAGGLWVFVGLIALSRPMLGVHYPSDVVAGMSLGLGWGFYWAALADWWDLRRMRGSAERVEQTQDPD